MALEAHLSYDFNVHHVELIMQSSENEIRAAPVRVRNIKSRTAPAAEVYVLFISPLSSST